MHPTFTESLGLSRGWLLAVGYGRAVLKGQDSLFIGKDCPFRAVFRPKGRPSFGPVLKRGRNLILICSVLGVQECRKSFLLTCYPINSNVSPIFPQLNVLGQEVPLLLSMVAHDGRQITQWLFQQIPAGPHQDCLTLCLPLPEHFSPCPVMMSLAYPRSTSSPQTGL